MSRFNGKSHYGQDELFEKIKESTREEYAAFVREQLASMEARPRRWHEDDKISYFANINQRSAHVVNPDYIGTCERTYRESDRKSYFANINQRSALVVNSGYSPSRFNGKSHYGQDELFEKIKESTREEYADFVRKRLKRD